jgi:hypothetical protein
MLTLAVAGCASSQNTATQGTVSPGSGAPTAKAAGLPTSTMDPACGSVPAALTGKWTVTIGPDDLPPELFDADTGVFVMSLGPGHNARTDVDSDHRGDDEDTCWTADHFVYVTDRADCTADSIGAYGWALRDDLLEVTPVMDDCFWRPFFLIFKPWTRVPD